MGDPAHHIAPIGGRAVQLVAHGSEEALFIGEGGRMIQRIRDGQRLTGAIIGQLRGVIENVRGYVIRHMYSLSLPERNPLGTMGV